MIEFKCSKCANKIEIDNSQANHQIQCPDCGQIQQVPGVNAPALGVVCTSCQTDMNVDATAAGQMVRCPNCGVLVAIPALGSNQTEGCLGAIALLCTIATAGMAGLAYLIRG